MKNSTILISLLILIFGACNSGSSESDHGHSHDAIALNDGAKWLVNDEMKPHIEKAEQILNTYIENKDTDYVQLAKDLKVQNSDLISSCTMEGKSHDELHKWLHPHLELVAQLKSAEAIDADALIEELSNSFAMYHEYFN